MKITRIRIANYRGVEAIDADVPPAGLLIKGPNASGKTSLLSAIRAALAARDIGDDAIRLGTDRAEILIDMDHASVTRVIRPGGTTVAVAVDGKPKAKPQKWLAEILGSAPLDPIELFAASPKQRRAIILGALPVRITRPQIDRWLTGDAAQIPEVRTFLSDLSGDEHGLEICAKIHELVYTHRSGVNSALKTIRTNLTSLTARRTELLKTTPIDAPPLSAIQSQIEAARAKVRDLLATAERVRKQEALWRHATKDADDMRTRASAIRVEVLASKPPTEADLAMSSNAFDVARHFVRECEERLTAARAEMDRAQSEHHQRIQVDQRARRQLEEAKALEERATSSLETIASMSEPMPPPEDFEAARAEVEAQEATLKVAERVETLRALDLEIDAARSEERLFEVRAGRLTGVVDAFVKDAPATLIAESECIHGLGVAGESITLDGVTLDGLSGKEQLAFAVEIARRANAQSKILIVDGLERVDDGALPEFIQHATKGGYQLIATRVDKGEVVLEAIEPDGAA